MPMSADAAVAPTKRRVSKLMLLAGLLCIAMGVWVIAGPLYTAWHRGAAATAATDAWQDPDNGDIAGPAPSASSGFSQHVCGDPASASYAHISFNNPDTERYAGVAFDGTWDMLKSQSMVHYKTTPAPGAKGNVIIAFHREPNYEHIDQLNVGGTVTIQDRTCKKFTYRVTQRWVLSPDKVTQLVPTTGHDLTMVTCTPFWDDSQRIIWRATLVP